MQQELMEVITPKKKPMEEGRYSALMQLAQTYVWRAEIDELQFCEVLTVLEALGFLGEMEMAMLDDVLKELYPSEARKSEA